MCFTRIPNESKIHFGILDSSSRYIRDNKPCHPNSITTPPVTSDRRGGGSVKVVKKRAQEGALLRFTDLARENV
jgi:hypothetical protein